MPRRHEPERVQQIAFRTVSHSGIDYRKERLSESSGLPDGAPRAGDRFHGCGSDCAKARLKTCSRTR
jgi:hypothetical protein